jgi:hypothetical protein
MADLANHLAPMIAAGSHAADGDGPSATGGQRPRATRQHDLAR